MALHQGFYTEIYEPYVEPDTLVSTRERAVSALLASFDSMHPGVIDLETRTPSSLEYGEALKQYADHVGNIGHQRVMMKFGALPVRKLVSVNDTSPFVNELFESERAERVAIYDKALASLKQSDRFVGEFPAYSREYVTSYMASELQHSRDEARPVELVSSSARETLFTRTLVQLRQEKQHLINIATYQKPRNLGRLATGTLLRTR